jgi:hypothetical protein
MSLMNGYLSEHYAKSLSGFGTPRRLARSGGWILERAVPGSAERDLVGCYPLFSCPCWSGLRADLDELEDQAVSIAAVMDPFGDHDPSYLRECFRDVVRPFKKHYVTDLSRRLESFVSRSHLRQARKALKEVDIECCGDPTRLVDDWVRLYAFLRARHGIRGIAEFSEEAFAGQLSTPGIIAFRAIAEGRTIGMILWYAVGELCYYHLGAYSDRGYQLRASFALFWRAFEHFQSRRAAWLHLGGGAGVNVDDAGDGLSRFKRGWATGTRTAYFCGRILDYQRYQELVRKTGSADTDFFPAYRSG